MSNTFKLRNGSILLSTEAPGGIYNSSQLKKIASICDHDSVIVKATEDQRLALLVNPEKANAIANELKAIGLGIRHYQDGLHQPVSCIGELCEDHEQDALGSALDISSELDGLELSTPLKIGINGCAKCCVPCHTLDISVVGDSHGYRISIGGKTSSLPEMASFIADSVPAAEMPRLVKSLVELYKTQAKGAETLQEVIEREGPAAFVKVLAPWSQDAADATDPFAAELETIPEEETVAETVEESVQESIAETVAETVAEPEAEPELVPESAADFAPIDEDNMIVHDKLAGEEEVSLDLDAATTDANDMDPTADFGGDNNTLGEIKVSNESDGIEFHVPIAEEPESIPEISLHEIEVEDTPTTLLAEPIEDGILEEPEHLTEVQIDAGDVLKFGSLDQPMADQQKTDQPSADQPKTDQPSADQQKTDHQAADSTEDQAVADLSADIAAQQDIMTDDTSDLARDESSDILEKSEINLAEDSLDTLVPDEEVSLDQIADAVGEDFDPEVGEDDIQFDVHDHLPLSEVVAATKLVKAPMQNVKKVWALSGFDIDDQGSPVITWTNGVKITVTPETIALGSVNIGGHSLKVLKINDGIQVEVDGMKLFLPAAA